MVYVLLCPLYTSSEQSNLLKSACDISTSCSPILAPKVIIGNETISVLRDADCSGVVTRKSLVPKDKFTDKSRFVC